MNIVNGKEREVVEILRGYGLCNYEAKAYFALLAVGESKAGDVARKAGVPQSKVYDVLDTLREKGFVEQNEDARPKEYKAFSLKDTTERVVTLRTREIAGLRKSMDRLNRVLEAVTPIHRQYETYRLFAPKYRTWKKATITVTD
jgi:sugar-specific transcriptional regulator TrmB